MPSMSQARAVVGVIGGTGLYSFLDDAEEVNVETPYGPPSGALTVARIGRVGVAFLPRHGRGHTIPPHRVNYRANLWALSTLGVERVLAPCAVGSLRADLAPGEVVICDQFLDRTHSRESTFFDGPQVAHLSAADPYCAELRPFAAAAIRAAGLVAHHGGTVVVVQGPRFSTRAESRHYAQLGDVINMTQYPEVVLARELGMCYVNLSLVTDYDTGVAGSPEIRPVTQEEVFAVFARNTQHLRNALVSLIDSVPAHRGCDCAAQRPVPLSH
jgi:5'-methylthioadenosine phosphorylase